ncbi:MAG: hypothetical protein GF399_12845 [Candidatus Coatesbacteria bacterium]|jgi:large repetitive protein|nr:hypothetical protein [Candidatus Coatesbacteria bacterium]
MPKPNPAPRSRPAVLLGLILLLCCAGAAGALDDIADYVVVSEILLAPYEGQAPFIELYNPTDDDVDLDGYFIKSSNGGPVLYLEDDIPAYGFYLIALADADWPTNWTVPDLVFPELEIDTLSGGIILYDTGELVDTVGWGAPITDYYEGTPCNTPNTGSSLERKSGSYHDEERGNGLDTQNNLFDFHLRGEPEPQNSDSPIEQPPSSADNQSWSYIKSLFGEEE